MQHLRFMIGRDAHSHLAAWKSFFSARVRGTCHSGNGAVPWTDGQRNEGTLPKSTTDHFHSFCFFSLLFFFFFTHSSHPSHSLPTLQHIMSCKVVLAQGISASYRYTSSPSGSQGEEDRKSTHAATTSPMSLSFSHIYPFHLP